MIDTTAKTAKVHSKQLRARREVMVTECLRSCRVSG